MSTTPTVTFAIDITANPSIQDVEQLLAAAREAGAEGDYEFEQADATLSLTFDLS